MLEIASRLIVTVLRIENSYTGTSAYYDESICILSLRVRLLWMHFMPILPMF